MTSRPETSAPDPPDGSETELQPETDTVSPALTAVGPALSGLTSVGLALVVVAVPLSIWVAQLPAWSTLRTHVVGDRHGWGRVGEVVLGDVGKPALVVASLALVWWCLRRSRRLGVVVAGLILVSNLTVQLLKHSPFDPGGVLGGLAPLSGHAALVGALSAGALLVAPSQRRQLTALVSAVLISGVAWGLMALGWHNPAEFLAPLLICLGWALVAARWLPRRHSPRLPAEGVIVAGIIVAGAVLAASGWAAAQLPVTVSDGPGLGLLSAAVFVLGVSTVVVGVLLGLPGRPGAVSPGT